jgi:hypothetical protein
MTSPKLDTCKTAVGSFSTDDSVACRPPLTKREYESSVPLRARIGIPPHLAHLFAAGDALLEAAIAVTETRIRHAVDEREHESAMRELAELHAQRGRY